MSKNLQHALALAAQGMPVFPVYWMKGTVCACRTHVFCKPGVGKHDKCTPDECKRCRPGKHPITWGGLYDATTDATKVSEFWRVAPEANIGIAVPDGIIIVDVDPRSGGEETFDALEAAHGKFPITRTVITGGKGGHFYFKAPGAFPSTLGKGIDVKQLGGFVLAPPSNHASGGFYQWAGAADAPIADAPAWLRELGHERGERLKVSVEDEDDRAVSDAELDRVIEGFTPYFVDGKKHHIAKNLGGWLKNRGFCPGDVVYVVERLPSTDPQARVEAARFAFTIERAFGWKELCSLTSEQTMEALDACTPNPRREHERAAAEGLAEAMAAGAVQLVTALPAANANAAPSANGNALPAAPANANANATYEMLVGAIGVDVDLSVPSPPRDYVVPALELGHGRANMLAGYGNAGKTIVAQAKAFAIAMGLPVWGQFPARRCRVLHLDFEAGESVRENYARLARAYRVPLAEMAQSIKVIDARTMLTAPQLEQALTALIVAGGFGFVVIDVLRAATGGVDENAAEMAIPLYTLGRISKVTRAAIEVLHHEKKPPDGKRVSVEHMISGHNAIHGALQVSISLVRDDESGLISVRSSKRIRRGFKPFQLRIVDVYDPADRDPGHAIANANDDEISWGVRVEVADVNSALLLTDDEKHELAIVEVMERYVAVLGRLAPDGTPIELEALRGEVARNNANQVAARRRLVDKKRIVVREGSGTIKTTVALVVGPHDPAALAPPVRDPRTALPADLPLSETVNDFRASLGVANDGGGK